MSQERTREQNMVGALGAWGMAIQALCRGKHDWDRPVGEIARLYMHCITDEASLDEVHEWFNWELVEAYIDEARGVSDGR